MCVKHSDVLENDHGKPADTGDDRCPGRAAANVGSALAAKNGSHDSFPTTAILLALWFLAGATLAIVTRRVAICRAVWVPNATDISTTTGRASEPVRVALRGAGAVQGGIGQHVLGHGHDQSEHQETAGDPDQHPLG